MIRKKGEEMAAKATDMVDYRYRTMLDELARMADSASGRDEFIEIMTAILHLTEARRERANVRPA
jgi:DUF438 domain-containing protein